MTDLVPCPLCGGVDGYKLQDGVSIRWQDVICRSCGELITECSVGNADTAWNEAGAYAEGLRQELAHARADIERLSVDLAEARREFEQLQRWARDVVGGHVSEDARSATDER